MGAKRPKSLVIYILCLSVWVFDRWSVRLYPINLKTAEPIKLTSLEATHVTPGNVYECKNVIIVLSKRKCRERSSKN